MICLSPKRCYLSQYTSGDIQTAVYGAGLVVVCLGTGQELENEGHDRADLNLPGHQLSLLKDAETYGKYKSSPTSSSVKECTVISLVLHYLLWCNFSKWSPNSSCPIQCWSSRHHLCQDESACNSHLGGIFPCSVSRGGSV